MNRCAWRLPWCSTVQSELPCRLFGLSLLAAGLAGNTGAWAQPPELKHNPFKRPVLEVRSQPPAIPDTGQQIELDLRATLVGGRRSLANIDGRFYRHGDEVAGHEVSRIMEGSVVLTRNGRQRRLAVHANETK